MTLSACSLPRENLFIQPEVAPRKWNYARRGCAVVPGWRVGGGTRGKGEVANVLCVCARGGLIRLRRQGKALDPKVCPCDNISHNVVLIVVVQAKKYKVKRTKQKQNKVFLSSRTSPLLKYLYLRTSPLFKYFIMRSSPPFSISIMRSSPPSVFNNAIFTAFSI